MIESASVDAANVVASFLLELPLDVDLALREIGDGLESADGKVDGLSRGARRAHIGDLCRDGLAI
jgi:F420-0:gamma-glutamyl ligase